MSGSKKDALDKDFAQIFFKPIAHYLSDPDTSEIMVNAHDDIWVENSQGMIKIEESFTPEGLESAVNSLAQYIGRPITENVYSIDARMPDGSRVCIVLPPVSGADPAFSIRLFKSVISDLSYLVDKNSLTDEMVRLIAAMVEIKKNMMVAGGTSSGKTTLLNLIAGTIPNEDRILTIEDSRELQMNQDHILPLEAKPPDKYGKGHFSIRDCLKSSLRLRPDRIVVGEIRGGEAFDLIQAMNTGHGGCMGTIHANNATETLRRLESISLMADIEIPLLALRAMIASALHVVICPARLLDRSRRIVQIAEVGPLNDKGDYQTFDIVRFTTTKFDEKTKKITGYFEFTGHVPSFFPLFAAEGVDLPREFFRKRVSGNVPAEIIPELLEQGYEVPGHESRPAQEAFSSPTEAGKSIMQKLSQAKEDNIEDAPAQIIPEDKPQELEESVKEEAEQIKEESITPSHQAQQAEITADLAPQAPIEEEKKPLSDKITEELLAEQPADPLHTEESIIENQQQQQQQIELEPEETSNVIDQQEQIAPHPNNITEEGSAQPDQSTLLQNQPPEAKEEPQANLSLIERFKNIAQSEKFASIGQDSLMEENLTDSGDETDSGNDEEENIEHIQQSNDNNGNDEFAIEFEEDQNQSSNINQAPETTLSTTESISLEDLSPATSLSEEASPANPLPQQAEQSTNIKEQITDTSSEEPPPNTQQLGTIAEIIKRMKEKRHS